MAGSLPVITVEIAFDSGFTTPMASRTYTDVSAYVDGDAGVDIDGYGRADERSSVDPTRCTLTLNNADGRFTPELASSPYYPNVKKGKPIRVKVTYPVVGAVTRFTGYIDEWPLTWPTGSDATANMTITASSRRARLGKTAELNWSPIRNAYFQPSEPQAYWAMNRNWTTTDGVEVFLDETNIGATNEVTQNRLFIHSDTAALYPSYTTNPRTGPIDENNENADGQPIGLLGFPKQSTISDYVHYAGSSNACRVNTAGEMTYEFVARILPPGLDTTAYIYLAEMRSPDAKQVISFVIASDGTGSLTTTGGGASVLYVDPDTGASVGYGVASLYNPSVWTTATDGEIHHYAITVTGGDTIKAYLDGVLILTGTLDAPYVFSQLTQFGLGVLTYNATAWIGHAAVRNDALTAAQVLDHATAATTSNETIEERMERIFGYMGVPAAEITAETSVALGVGDQSQVGRAPTEVIDELAESTGGVLYDKRDGTLTMQARNHRYNQTSAFTLSTTGQEIEGDLTGVLDDRYLVNYIEYKRAETDDLTWYRQDPTSIDTYGLYSGGTLEAVTTSWEEAQATAIALVTRYAEPEVRVSTVAVDVMDLSSAQQVLVLAADIGTLFTVAALPGQAPSTSLPLYLEGYSESISAAGHIITMNTTPGDLYTNVLVLDDAAHDVLDSGVTLAY